MAEPSLHDVGYARAPQVSWMPSSLRGVFDSRWAFSEERVKVGRLGGQQGTSSNSVTRKVRQDCTPRSSTPTAAALLTKRNATVIHTWGRQLTYWRGWLAVNLLLRSLLSEYEPVAAGKSTRTAAPGMQVSVSDATATELDRRHSFVSMRSARRGVEDLEQWCMCAVNEEWVGKTRWRSRQS